MSEVHYLAIDPGGVHCGVAYMVAQIAPMRLHVLWTRDLKPDTLDDLLWDAKVDGWVIEAFRLYPELAREQGYSDFPTVERIGVARHIARKRGLRFYRQGADVKRRARRIGERISPDQGKIRRIGSTRGSYAGWDFNARTQHERDAISHGVWWAFENRASHLHGFHEKHPRAKLVIACP